MAYFLVHILAIFFPILYSPIFAIIALIFIVAIVVWSKISKKRA